MSTATIPFLSRRGFLPFCASEANFSNSTYNSVALTEVSGDEGLAHAMSLWWNLENIEFTPSGTQTLFPGVISFSKTFRAFTPNTTELTRFETRGAIAGNNGITSTSTPNVEPAFRQCPAQGAFQTGMLASLNSTYTKTEPDDPTREACAVVFYIGYSSNRWRLYYTFDFRVFSPGAESLGLFIFNPNFSSGVPEATGTVSLFGLTLNWEGFGNFSPSGFGLSASSTNWSF